VTVGCGECRWEHIGAGNRERVRIPPRATGKLSPTFVAADGRDG
jgi:hypothetical protein